MRGRKHPRNIHDAFVRRVFSRVDTVSILLCHVLPPRCLEYLQLDTLAQGSSAYAGIELDRRDSDLLFSVQLRETTRRIAIYIALDHQSTSDRLMPWRELEYIVHIWSRHLRNQLERPKTLPFILPIVLLQRPAWTTPTRLSEIIDLPDGARSAFGTPIELEMLTDDLRRPILAGSHDDPHAIAYVEAARILLHAHANPNALTDQRLTTLVPLFETLLDPKCSDDITTLWAYIVGVFGEGSPIYATLLPTITSRNQSMTDEEILMKPWITKGLRKGLQKGLQKGRTEGRTEGRAEGRARSLVDVLELRALPLPRSTRQRILSTRDESALERWFRRALAAASLDEIFEPGEPLPASPPHDPALGRR